MIYNVGLFEMFKKLFTYNWKVFRHSLTATKLFVLVFYGIFLVFVFSQVITTVFVIVALRTSELSNTFAWYTPERGRFILLAFTNLFWMAQFFFTNIRLLKLKENRKLLTVGYPVHKLARHLALLAFGHPLNLLFNLTWLVLLLLQFGSYYYVPIALAIVVLNFSVIFSVKFRMLEAIRNYQKWLLSLLTGILVVASASIDQLFTSSLFEHYDAYIPTLNRIGSVLPGGLIAGLHTALQPWYLLLGVTVVSLAAIALLHRDHIRNTRRRLQSPKQPSRHQQTTGKLRNWLCTQLGNHAGKYLYYVLTHPYNKIQGLLFIALPIFYVPYLISGMERMESMNFLIFFIFMYAPMGFQLIFLGNMFGYEHRELLKEMQFPISLKKQLTERFLGALIIPTTLLVIVTGSEVILLWDGQNLMSVILGNILIFESFIAIFLWSTLNHFKVVEWVSFSFSQPVISQPVALMISLLMMVLSALIYISYGSYEIYKQLVMAVTIIGLGLGIYRYINNIQQVFTSKITPDLWTER